MLGDGRDEVAGLKDLRKLGLQLVPLRIGLVEYKEVIGSQRVALIKENGTCKQLLE
jgi:hypothetical protein